MTHKPVTLYTKPNCQPCRATKKWLDRRGIQYREVDITTSPDDLKAAQSLGFMQSPVVVVGTWSDDAWSGFDTDQLEYHFPTGLAAA